MYIVVENHTQLCNQLFLAAHVIATARETRHSVINLAFTPYAHQFPATAHDLLCRYPAQPTPWLNSPQVRQRAYRLIRRLGRSLEHGRLRRLPSRFGVVRSGQSSTLDTTQQSAARQTYELGSRTFREAFATYELASPAFREGFARHRVIFMFGPLFRNHGAVQRQAAAIREYFRPPEAVLACAQQAIEQARTQGEIVIGLHIRRGDYRTFVGGRYYYPLEDYLALMERVPSLFPGRKVIFCVCSDEPQTPATFAGHNYVMGPGGAMEDLYTLAGCDCLIGPPSTFSAWASFHGQVPLYFMHDPTHVPALDEFVANQG